MKKICLLLAIVSLFVSCEEGDTSTNWSVVNLVANQSDWVAVPENNGVYYSCGFDMPEITSFVYSDGLVQVYCQLDGAQQVLPYTCYYKNSTTGYVWSRTIDYQYSPGILKVFVTYSDYVPTTMETFNFRAVVMW
jgi:hypothetical protein